MKILSNPTLYGRSIPSIAEQLGKTPKEAETIYNKLLNKFEGLRGFMEESEDMAREYGYVTTMSGRRRNIPDMQLPLYEFSYKKGYNPDFDPLSNTDTGESEVPIKKVEELTRKLLRCKWYKDREALKERIRNSGINVKDNTRKIGDATRQCVNCVDVETEILTTSGWKTYKDISIGDQILNYNMNSGKIEVDTISSVHVYEGTFDVAEFKSNSFKAVSTLDHRWVSNSSKSNKSRFVKTEKIISNKYADYPILKIADNNLPDNVEYSDNMLRLISYVLADGSMSTPSSGYKFELCRMNKEDKHGHVYSEIISVLNSLGLTYTDNCRFNDYHEIRVHKSSITSQIIDLFPHGVMTFDFIKTLSQRQALFIVDVFVNCDSHRDRGSHVTFETREKADAFQFLCVIAGYSTSMRVRNAKYVVSILKRKRVHIDSLHYSMKQVDCVWCVSTSNETWIARRNGTVFITGNSRVQGRI